MKELPPFYYHDHFLEFIRFIQTHCSHLLHEQHRAFIATFFAQSKSVQAMLVRCLNRKAPVIKRSTLMFAELERRDALLDELGKLQWIRKPMPEDASTLLQHMLKDELFELYDNFKHLEQLSGCKLNRSMPKQLLADAVCLLPNDIVCSSAVAKNYIIRGCDDEIDYLLYIYFGNCVDRLNKFSMRDLGIMTTREEEALVSARFDSKEVALSNFQLERQLLAMRRHPPRTTAAILQHWQHLPEAIGERAIELKHKAEYKLACAMLPLDHSQAVQMLEHNQSAPAQEKWCREAYKAGQTESVLVRLQTIAESPVTDHLAYFAEDFLARKYQQKRTSLITDMLRQASKHITIDETFKGNVEKGTMAYYRNQVLNSQQSIQVYFTENNVWRALFTLTFWTHLFDTPGLGLATEFDYLPQCLKHDNLYALAGQEIERTLDTLSTGNCWQKHLLTVLCEHIHKKQGIFTPRQDLTEQLSHLLQDDFIDGLKMILRLMAQQWHNTKDGFPDLMVVEDGKVRFEEVKGEGDVIRRNQLMRIQQLRDVGFDVRITSVEFAFDPMQPYVVVDIETTGGRAQHHRITEIGMVKMIDGKIVDRWQSLLNPQRRIPKNIVALTGITDDMVADAPLFGDIADEINAFTEDAIFVAHNVNFDYGFIREEFARINRRWRRPKLCTVQQMRRHFKGLPSYSLANLTRHFGISMQRHHRAMSDALAAAHLLTLVNEKRASHA